MTRKIKILQLQNRYNVNASDLAEQVIQGLPTETYEVTTVFLRGRPRPGEPESRAARSVYFNLSNASTKGLRLRALWMLYKHCRAQGYDAVIAHRFKPINMLMVLNLWLRIRVCIGVLHGLGEYDRAYRRWESRILIGPAWRMVGVSRAVYDDLIRSGAGFGPHNVRQINNAIDISRAERLQHPKQQARQLLGLPQDAFVVGTIGRLVPVKAHIHLIEAFAEIKDRYPKALLAIIGEGRSRQELETFIRARRMEQRVLLLGARDDALQYVRAYDVFVMSSVSEGLPLALLEGMSGCLPVIGSDIDSMRPILEDSGGRIYPVGQPLALAERLREVISLTPRERAEEGLQAYEYLCRAHAIEDFRRQYRSLLEDMLKYGRRRHG
ncbi:glycosyltransferase [Pseudomonas knackmussii]|uniref:Glycosyltransferase n=1 Tax=Pseudomonas knackmussii TaxID=65741 RepID=A0ABY4KSM8_9PSED|nr:glycosyltransferase [Pseudomonas knackmussii]UPQ82360.1 glycosyltransferase [Pseudomonas knackmussii]